jgi:Abnormal spindle-like microcephaly-assoc'd, ASPM-SPD-2-Hydin
MDRLKCSAIVATLLLGLMQATPVLAKKGCPELKFNPKEAKFGKVPVGTTGTVTVTNSSKTESADIVGAAANDKPPFDVDETNSTCSGELMPGATCKLVVTCTPTEKGKFSGHASVVFGTEGCKPQKFKLTCDGVAPVGTPTATATATPTATRTA